MPVPADLQPFVTDELKADPVAWPVLEKMTEQSGSALLKSYGHAQHRLGSAITLPGKDAKPEDVAALKQRLYDAGLFSAPPGKPEEYGITKPEGLPAGIAWSDERASKLAAVLHKHGVPKAAATDLLALHTEALIGAQAGLKTTMDEALAALKKEHADKYDERYEAAARLSAGIFKTEDEIAFAEQTGIANHPAFLNILMRLAPLAMQDSSFLKEVGRPAGSITGDEARAELAKIMNDPSHPKHKAYHARDPKVLAEVDAMYKRAYGDKAVTIGEGIVVGPRPAGA